MHHIFLFALCFKNERGDRIIVIGVFWVSLTRAMPETEMRALCFFALVLCVLALVLVNRSFSASLRSAFAQPSLALIAVLGFVTIVLAASLSLGPIREIFRFGPLHGDDLLIVMLSGAALLLVLEAFKLFWPRILRKQSV